MMFDNFHSVVSGLRSQMYEFLGYYSYIFKKIAYICSQVKLIKSNEELI